MTQIVLNPVAKLKNGAKYNALDSVLEVAITYDFKTPTTGTYRVACVIIEDSVTGTIAGYNQANYYAGGNSGTMGGYESLPNPVLAANMRYDHVARAIAPNYQGMIGFPSTIAAGYKQTHNFNFDISAWNKDKIHIVGLLINPNGKIENASTSTIDEAVSNGFVLGAEGMKIKPEAISLYPNPAHNSLKLEINATESFAARVFITDILGKIIYENKSLFQSGFNRLPINIEGLSNGIYTLNIHSDENNKHALTFVKE
jgi:hypothetical protein